jgi:hypothetical protein
MKFSFFKLPFFFVLFYWMLDSIFAIGSAFFVNSHFHSDDVLALFSSNSYSISLLNNIILTNTFNQLANLVLVFITSAIVLNQYFIYRVNANNLLYAFTIVLLIIIGLYAYQIIFAQQTGVFLNSYLLESYFFYTYRFYIGILRFVSYIWIFMGICLGIKLLRSVFVTELEMIALPPKYSQKIHLSLFILLFNFYYLVIVLFFLNYFLLPDFLFESDIFAMSFHSIFLLICNTVGYIALRKQFTSVGSKLQLKNLAFSSAIAFSVTLVLSIIVFFINTYFMNLGWLDKMVESLNDKQILAIAFSYIIAFFVVLCLIGWLVVRKVVKIFFSK